MKKAMKLICTICGAAVIWNIMELTWLGGIGFAHGMAIGNPITHDDIQKSFQNDGFSFKKTAYFAGVLTGQDHKDI